MEIEEIRNEALKSSIEQCIQRVPACKKIFDEMSSIIGVVDIVCSERNISPKNIEHFAWGLLVVTPLSFKRQEHEQEANELTKPVVEEVKSYCENEYEDYLINNNSNISFLTESELTTIITSSGIKQFLRNRNQTPLTDEEIQKLIMIYEQEQRFST
jgi:hypothetical protein